MTYYCVCKTFMFMSADAERQLWTLIDLFKANFILEFSNQNLDAIISNVLFFHDRGCIYDINKHYLQQFCAEIPSKKPLDPNL